MARFALLIGISKYDSPLVTPIPSAKEDIYAFQKVLVNSSTGLFPPKNVLVLENPSRMEMESEVYNLFKNKKPEDVALLFFSGHGILDDWNQFYFATRDTNIEINGEFNPITTVSALQVQTIAQRSRSKKQILILDSCYSGAFSSGLIPKDDNHVNIKSQLGGRGRIVLTSSNSAQRSFFSTESKLSIYTNYLLEGIITGAADSNCNGYISVLEMHDYAKQKIASLRCDMSPRSYSFDDSYNISIAKTQKGLVPGAISFENFKSDFFELIGEKLKNRINDKIGDLIAAMSSQLGDRLTYEVIVPALKKWRNGDSDYVKVEDLEKQITIDSRRWIDSESGQDCIRLSLKKWFNNLLVTVSEDISILAKRHDIPLRTLVLDNSQARINSGELEDIIIGDLTPISSLARGIPIVILALHSVVSFLGLTVLPLLIMPIWLFATLCVGAVLAVGVSETKSTVEDYMKRRNIPVWLRKQALSDSNIQTVSTNLRSQLSERISESLIEDSSLKTRVCEQTEKDIKQALNKTWETVMLNFLKDVEKPE